MVSVNRPSPAWSGLLALTLVGCFDDPPMVGEDETTAATPPPTTPSTTSGSTTVDPPTTTTSSTDSTGPELTTDGPTETTLDPDGSESSTTGPPPECDANDGLPDQACPPATPFCIGGSCVPCSAGGDCSALDPLTPICDGNDVCQPCVEHSECPGGAGCHLYEGSCLPSDRVYYVDPDANCGPGDATEAMPACSIGQAFGASMGQPQITIRLQPSAYLEEATIPSNRVIAFIGTGEVTIVTSGGAPTLTVDGTAYLSGIDVQNFDLLGTGIDSSGDLWLDDSMVRNNEVGIDAGMGRVTLRRSRVLDCRSVAVLLGGGQTATFLNTIVAGNGDDVSPTAGGIVSTGAGPIDVLYSTIVENTGVAGGAIDCGAGPATVRNSIVVSQTLSDAIDCGGGTTVTHSVIADAQFDGDPTNWALMDFGNLMMDMNYEIAAGSVANDRAQWEQGDPLTDINGAPRPAVPGSPDYAGADLPD